MPAKSATNPPDERPLRIFVVAASPARRADLAEMAVRVAPVRAATAPGIDRQRIANFAAGILIVDIDRLELARAAVRMAAEQPAGSAVIALADNPDSRWVTQAVASGVSAILSREVTPEELRLAILAAEAGLVVLHPASAQRIWPPAVSATHPDAEPALADALTAREHGILRLLSEGLGNKEIAARLAISEHTVKFHVSSILAKLGVSTRTEAVSQGIRSGLIPI